MVKATGTLVTQAKGLLEAHQDLYFTGFTQDAQKEYAEACCVYAFIASDETANGGDNDQPVSHQGSDRALDIAV